MVKKMGLEIDDHLIPYPLGWVRKEAKAKVTKQCRINFSLSIDFIDEVELYVVPLDASRVIFVFIDILIKNGLFLFL